MAKGIRRLSDASPLVSAYLRDRVASDLRKRYDDGSDFVYVASMAGHSIQLPENPTSGWYTDVYFTDQRLLRGLEESSQINWCPKFPKMVPLSVPNDGNSLCHAVSIAIWGVADRGLVLRKAVCDDLQGGQQEEFHRRWSDDWRKDHLAADNEVPQEDWSTLVNLATCDNKSGHPNYPLYDPLDHIHVFVIANVLRRPIIVYGDSYTSGTRIPLGSCSGIHLPLLWHPTECVRSPLLLGFSEGSFCPLVPICGHFSQLMVPLVGRDMAPLRMRFLKSEEEGPWEQLLVSYLELDEVDILRVMVKAAVFQQKSAEETQRLVAEFFRCRGRNADGTYNSWNMNAVQDALPRADRRRTSRFRCGNKECSEFIEKDHTFPFCRRCSDTKVQFESVREEDKGAKRKTGIKLELTTSLNVECETVGCSYTASVNSFPFCQRCHELKEQQGASDPPPKKEMKLEEKWMRLAMGIVDQEVLSQNKDSYNREESNIVFSNRPCSSIPLEQDESAASYGATSLCSVGAEKPPRTMSATGLRSNLSPVCRSPKGELQTAALDLPRKISWTTEACASLGCPYFASLCCYPYCNQCANSSGVRRKSFSAATSNDTNNQPDGSLAG